jgi:hypothetical protein
MTLMRHFLTAHTNQTTRSDRMTSSTPWSWQVLVITAFLCLGLISEGLAAWAVRPTSLTFYAVQGATNPPNQTISFSRTPTNTVTLTATDNASWLTVSPARTSITTNARLTVTINTNGLGAGTYRASITIKLGTWTANVVPVTLIISPPSGGGGGTTSSAALTWNAVTGTPLSGYKVYVGEAPKLYTRTITLGTVTSTTVSSLTRGRTYYFAVAAYNSAGQSTPSNEVSKTIP